jgi:hypothetical protein
MRKEETLGDTNDEKCYSKPWDIRDLDLVIISYHWIDLRDSVICDNFIKVQQGVKIYLSKWMVI